VRAPSVAQLLDAWECALAQSPTGKALTLLAQACPESSTEELAALPIGERDGRLVELRRMLFGSELSIVASCPVCRVRLESSVHVDEIWPDGDRAIAGPPRTCAADGYRLTFRLPASQDLMALPGHTHRESARHALLARCLTEALDADGKTVAIDALPVHVVAAVEAQMAAADPQADVQLHLACPACAHRWRMVFDIASFLWQEIQAWAQRTLREVHGLARAYGWRESDVLALSPTRRQIYLELAGQ
jgi:hypothetical protein